MLYLESKCIIIFKLENTLASIVSIEQLFIRNQ